MRTDMYKVIVERPRKGKHPYALAERLRNDPEGPSFLGMRAGYGQPGLNENLSPLKRFLQKQVGRPWSKVYAEISEHMDRRNTVQQHIYQHIDDFIAIQAEWKDGEIVDLKNRDGWRRSSPRQSLYVDPRTGLICRKPFGASRSKLRREQRAQERAELDSIRKIISADLWLMRIDEQWYEVRRATLPAPVYREERVAGRTRLKRLDRPLFDVVRKSYVRSEPYDRGSRVYSQSKRQLSHRELVRHGLR
jgi:hypothetical protein